MSGVIDDFDGYDLACVIFMKDFENFTTTMANDNEPKKISREWAKRKNHKTRASSNKEIFQHTFYLKQLRSFADSTNFVFRQVGEMETKKDVEDDDGERRMFHVTIAAEEDYVSSSSEESVHLPAISPVSNISSSSGIGSASSSNYASKPTTPTNLHLTDKSDDEYLCHSDNNNKVADTIIIKDNESDIEELAISRRCDSEQIESGKNNRYSSSIGAGSCKASTSKSVKIRSKHRQSRKHISLDDEIVIYESDSSLQIDPRRRNIHAMYSNRTTHQNLSRGSAAISRRMSEESSSTTQPSNQIVSILKRKDSSTSSNASLVTFSPNVIDIESTEARRPTHRQGILKKRSSLDESLRSHSPSSASSESERGCLVRNNRRRNSSEDINHHGILKQKSYDSSGGGSAYSSGIGGGSSGGCNTPNTPNSSVQGILKKPSLTPSDQSSDQPTKHVSISEAVILAAAELCKDMIIIDDSQSESYIKPILKLDNDHQQHARKPKPILKKNHSSENEEIRSILKSRKSSREELLDDENL